MTRPAPQVFTVLPSIHVYSMVSMVTRVLFVAVVLWGSPRIFAHLNHVKDFITAAGFWLNTYISMARKRAAFRLLLSATRIRSTAMKNADFFSKLKGAATCGFSSSNKMWSSSSNSLSSVNAASPRKMRKPVRDYTVHTITIINEELWLGVFCISTHQLHWSIRSTQWTRFINPIR